MDDQTNATNHPPADPHDRANPPAALTQTEHETLLAAPVVAKPEDAKAEHAEAPPRRRFHVGDDAGGRPVHGVRVAPDGEFVQFSADGTWVPAGNFPAPPPHAES